jgi:hypothetical protein
MEANMKKPTKPSSRRPTPPPGRENFLIFMVVGVGIMGVLSYNFAPGSKPSVSSASVEQSREREKGPRSGKSPATLSPTDVPLATGDEPIDKLFVQSGCAVCHTIPGIGMAKGREGPKLALGTTAPARLADPDYDGQASTVREYIQESILEPGAYVVKGYNDRVMPRWYGKRLNAKALDRMIEYLEDLTE